MTIFELVFFIFSIVPEITDSIHKLLNKYTKNSDSENSNSVLDPDPMIVLNVLNIREYKLIDQLNLNSYLIIIALILLLISSLFYFQLKIKNLERIYSTNYKYIKHAIKTAISTIICLVLFQIFFYNYGLSFKYIGSSEEMIVLFINSVI